MADAHAKHHDYHLVDPSPWPIVASISALVTTGGAVWWFHGGPVWVMVIGLAMLAYMFFAWWKDVINEGEHKGDHTPVVQLGLRYGMALFIASEVMFFVAWFWAFFDASLFPKEAIGGVWPPKGVEALDPWHLPFVNTLILLLSGTTVTWAYFNAALMPTDAIGGTWPPQGIEVFDPWHLPFVNTLILLLSGTTVTWAHHALIEGDRKGLIQGLWCTVLLGALFTCVQAWEYVHAPYSITSTIYGSTFFMATGFHGAHVLIGTTFLLVNLIRAYKGHFSPKHHFGFEAAAWYWHFVDVVWLFLFVSIYWWGSYGGVIVHE